MRIEPMGTDSLRVWLSREEMQQWGLCGPQPKKGIRHLTRLVRRRLGLAPDNRLTATLLVVERGGILWLTPFEINRGEWPAVYYLPNEELLYALAVRWCRMAPQPQVFNSVYAYNTGYAVAVYPVLPLKGQWLRLLEEYAFFLGRGLLKTAACAEYGQLLTAGAGLEQWMGLTAAAPSVPEPPDFPR